MILEGIVTTIDAAGEVNIAPMGPIVDERMQRLILRPFQTSQTFGNLQRSGQGVLHVTDDVELLAQAAVGRPEPWPKLIAAEAVEGWILANACRWYAFRVQSIDASRPRGEIVAEVVATGRFRDFFGFNRAKHAVIEAAILATRRQLISAEVLRGEFARLRSPVEKTGGPAERRAFDFLVRYVEEGVAQSKGGGGNG